MKIPFTQTVINSGRVTIPLKIREMLNIQENDYVFIEIEKYTISKKEHIYKK